MTSGKIGFQESMRFYWLQFACFFSKLLQNIHINLNFVLKIIIGRQHMIAVLLFSLSFSFSVTIEFLAVDWRRLSVIFWLSYHIFRASRTTNSLCQFAAMNSCMPPERFYHTQPENKKQGNITGANQEKKLSCSSKNNDLWRQKFNKAFWIRTTFE